MENASRALLIAGTILIVILLIAAGMRLFNSTSSTEEMVETSIKSSEVETFNSKFMQYFGTKKKQSDIQSLVNAVIENNGTTNYKVGVFFDQVYLNDITTTGGSKFIRNPLDSIGIEKTLKYIANMRETDNYNITGAYYDKSGRIGWILVKNEIYVAESYDRNNFNRGRNGKKVIITFESGQPQRKLEDW